MITERLTRTRKERLTKKIETAHAQGENYSVDIQYLQKPFSRKGFHPYFETYDSPAQWIAVARHAVTGIIVTVNDERIDILQRAREMLFMVELVKLDMIIEQFINPEHSRNKLPLSLPIYKSPLAEGVIRFPLCHLIDQDPSQVDIAARTLLYHTDPNVR